MAKYKHLYEQSSVMLAKYQDELMPQYRKIIEELEADNERLRNMWAEAVSKGSKLEAKIPRWIPVAEQLPNPETDVLVNHSDDIEILTFGYDRYGELCFKYQDEDGYIHTWAGCKITHWMPLPEPPKGEM